MPLPASTTSGVLEIPNWAPKPDEMFSELINELPWEKRPDAPRFECWMVNRGFRGLHYKIEQDDYAYGKAPYERTYKAQVMHTLVQYIQNWMFHDARVGVLLEGCFANRYENERNHLGWHADDSELIDHTRPIVIISFGEERLIEFRPKDREDQIEKLRLTHGGLAIMPAGFQQTHRHRIPKGSRQMDRRISLTFRGLL